MYSPIKSLPTSLLQREENKYPPCKMGEWGDLNFVHSMDRLKEIFDERQTG